MMGGKYPLFVEVDGRKVFQWKNLFKMDWRDVALVGFIVLFIVSFLYDTGKCDDVVDDPCGFCDRSGCCNRLNFSLGVIADEEEAWQQVSGLSFG